MLDIEEWVGVMKMSRTRKVIDVLMRVTTLMRSSQLCNGTLAHAGTSCSVGIMVGWIWRERHKYGQSCITLMAMRIHCSI